MPGTFAINTDETFTTALLMSAAPKPKFGEQVQDTSTAGVPKWALEVAVTFRAEPGMRPVSEVLQVTVTASADPAQGITVPAAVVLDGFRVGISPPEKTERGTIRGGKLWYQATGIHAAGHSTSKRDAA